MAIAIVVLTHNRVHLLRQCVERVLLRTSEIVEEIVIWNNGSTDGTSDYLASLTDPRLQIVESVENVGLNGYARAIAMTRADYLIELDDDIIDAPLHWDAQLLRAFARLPDVGYLAANLIYNPKDTTSRIMYEEAADRYYLSVENGVRLKLGPTGGGCTLTSRQLYDKVGGFRTSNNEIFWQEDAEFVRAIERLGYRAAYLDDLSVLHAGGAHYSEQSEAKLAFWRDYNRRLTRRNKLKRILLYLPLMSELNARLNLFVPPSS